MIKYIFGILMLCCFSCVNKEDILLPKAGRTIVKEVVDLSPIYIFFRVKGKDTLAEVNRKNSIITTNWILNIDKRLPLRLIIPEVMKLQQKKREEKEHRNEKAENYYSYADSIGKNLAFMPFTAVYYTIGKPEKNYMTIQFKKGNNFVLVDDIKISKQELVNYVYSIDHIVKPGISLVFDKNMTYGEYIQTKILLRKFNSYNDKVPREFIY